MMRESVRKFVEANDASPVVAGSVPLCGGAYYKLGDGRWIKLSRSACQELPEGYPRWRFDEGMRTLMQ